MTQFTFSWHALTRMVEMAITPEQVRATLLHPEKTRLSRKYGDECLYYIRGQIVLVVHFADKHVVTALWNRFDEKGNWMPRFKRDIEEDLARIRKGAKRND